jgi:hypothetical protein
VAPGADGELTLIEDDGTGATPDDIPAARTRIALRGGTVEIGPADDPHGVLPAERTWTVTVAGLGVSETVGGPPGEALRVELGAGAPNSRQDALFEILNTAHFGHAEKLAAWRTLSSELPVAAKLAELHAQGLPRALIGALAELLTA